MNIAPILVEILSLLHLQLNHIEWNYSKTSFLMIDHGLIMMESEMNELEIYQTTMDTIDIADVCGNPYFCAHS
jgi:hypothetical protein